MRASSLRRATSSILVPAYLATGFFALFHRGMPWRGEWAWTLDVAGGTTLLIAPLVAGASAWDASVLQREALRDVARSTVNGDRALVAAVFANAVWGWLVLVVVVCVGLALTWSTLPEGFPRLWPALAPGCHVLFASAAGALIGRWLPGLVASPLAVVSVFALLPLGVADVIPNFVKVGASTGSLVGLTWSAEYLLTACTTLVAFATSILLLVRAWDAPRRSMVALLTGGVIGLVGVAAAAHMEHVGLQRFVTASAPPEYRCAGSAPEVCVASSTVRMLEWLTVEVAESAEVLRKVGIDVPTRFEEDVIGREPRVGIGYFYLNEPNASQGDISLGAVVVTTPSYCPAFSAGPPEVYFDTSQTLQNWILLQRGLIDLTDIEVGRDAAWLSAPYRAQLPWIRRTYDNLRHCRLEALAAPTVS